MMGRLQEYYGQYTITIPKDIIDLVKWEKGQPFIISYNEKGNLELIKVNKVIN